MTTTPLEQHREANADVRELTAIRERIAAAGVEYIYYQGVTITGRVIGKVVPARHLARNAEKGVQLHRTAAADLQTTREGQLLGGGVEAAEFTMLPDLDTFAVLPWDTKVARFFCRLYEPGHRAGDGGQAYAMDNACPHAGGSMSAGWVHDGCAVCPWHAWPFKLDSGELRDAPGVKIRTYPVRVLKPDGKPALVQADLPAY